MLEPLYKICVKILTVSVFASQVNQTFDKLNPKFRINQAILTKDTNIMILGITFIFENYFEKKNEFN